MIFRKYLVGSAILAMLATSTTAFAAGKPWKTSAPRGMAEQHQQYAAAARRVHAEVGAARFGYNPLQANWRYQGDRNYTLPLSNMTKAALKDALEGRYHVFSRPGEGWSVRYYSPNGTVHFCDAYGKRGRKEWAFDLYIHKTSFGLAGIMGWDARKEGRATPPPSEQFGWPTVGNPSTGEFYTYNWIRGRWVGEQGWLQDDYAAIWAEECPELPRSGQVNAEQSGQTLAQIARGARSYRGFDVAFPNNPRDPLTAGMYYHLYPPVRQ